MNLTLSAINVNSLNMSTYKESGCKTLEKIVAITEKGCDIILITDCRLGKGIEKLRKAFLVGKNMSYNLISNSTRGERGVCIAVNRNRDIEILEIIKVMVSENYLLLRCKVDGYEMLLGGVYGPNTNNRGFYRELIAIVNRIGLPTIIGGDFNTVLDGNQGAENLDLEDRENIPQKENGKILRDWMEEKNLCDPFRTKYPMAHVMSYKPFRTRRRIGDRWETINYGRSRLDFYIISRDLYKDVDSVYYGSRLSRDFDHMEAILKLGKSTRKKERVFIRNETLDRPEIEEIGVLGYLDCLSNHLQVRDEGLARRVGELEMMYVENVT